uniref:Uncharacterized protein n=1 Tax=Brassica oleracea var. oleracea TaxID=109376 RepID=A0A0D3BJL6_BRAOL
MIQAKIKSSIIIPSVKEDKILISLSTKHAAKPPSGPDPPFSGVWRSSPALEMISLSSFIYGCSSWWYLVCSPATSLPHQLRCKRWCNGGVVLCGEQNRPTSFRSFRSPVTSPYQPADEGLVEKGRLISGVCFLSNLVGFVVLAWYRELEVQFWIINGDLASWYMGSSIRNGLSVWKIMEQWVKTIQGRGDYGHTTVVWVVLLRGEQNGLRWFGLVNWCGRRKYEMLGIWSQRMAHGMRVIHQTQRYTKF